MTETRVEEKDIEEDEKKEDEPASTALTVNTADLNKESLAIINQIITEQDADKAKDLTYLFNVNQNKKTLVRTNKLNDLLDIITDEAVSRFTNNPEQIDNKGLLDALKIVQDLIERSQKQVSGDGTQPLIQINEQHNSINVGTDGQQLSRDSRERVKNAVLDLLGGLTDATKKATDKDIHIVDVDAVPTAEPVEGENDDD